MAPKRKAIPESEDEGVVANASDVASAVGSGEDEPTPAKKPRKSATKGDKPTKKPKSKSKPTSDGEEEDSSTKNKKKNVPRKSSDAHDSDEEVTVLKNDDGDRFVELGPSRRVTVREFKGKALIDIREYYTDKSDGKEKPGKKGISLTPEQWEAIKKATPYVDAMIARKQQAK